MNAGQFDPRLVAYFGDPVLQSSFMPLPNLFLRHYTQLGLCSLADQHDAKAPATGTAHGAGRGMSSTTLLMRCANVRENKG